MNKVILIGRLTRDPELRTTPTGTSVTRFSVAINRPVSSQNGGEPQTDFINCVAWNRQAENIAKYCTKGSQVAVDGRIQTGSYTGQDGQKKYTTDVVASNVTFLGSRSDNNSNGYQPMPSYNEPQELPTTDVTDTIFDEFKNEVSLSDDDLPF